MIELPIPGYDGGGWINIGYREGGGCVLNVLVGHLTNDPEDQLVMVDSEMNCKANRERIPVAGIELTRVPGSGVETLTFDVRGSPRLQSQDCKLRSASVRQRLADADRHERVHHGVDTLNGGRAFTQPCGDGAVIRGKIRGSWLPDLEPWKGKSRGGLANLHRQ